MSEETQETRPVNGKSMYSYIADAWNVPSKSYVKDLNYERRIQWRKEENFCRIERPTRLDRARALGYKAKQGYVVVRARVRKGSFQKRAIVTGRRAKRKGINQITVGKSLQRMAEERTAKRYPNLEVLNSYWVGADGQQSSSTPHTPSSRPTPRSTGSATRPTRTVSTAVRPPPDRRDVE